MKNIFIVIAFVLSTFIVTTSVQAQCKGGVCAVPRVVVKAPKAAGKGVVKAARGVKRVPRKAFKGVKKAPIGVFRFLFHR